MSGSSSIALRMTILALCLYLCAGSAMVVVTKARYGAIDDLRYVFQYSWIAVTLVALSLTSASLTRSTIKARDFALPLILVVLMFGRAGFAWQTADKEYRTQALFREYADWRSVAEHLPDPNWILTTQIKISLADNAPLEQAIERLPPNAYIMSNMAGVFIQTTKRPIRYIEADTPEGIARALVDLSKAIKAAHAPRPVYCVIAPTNRLVKIKGACSWTDTLVDDLPADYAIEWRRNDILILHYQPQDVSAKRFGTTTGADGHGR